MPRSSLVLIPPSKGLAVLRSHGADIASPRQSDAAALIRWKWRVGLLRLSARTNMPRSILMLVALALAYMTGSSIKGFWSSNEGRVR